MPEGGSKSGNNAPGSRPTPRDQAIASLAARQHGVVSDADLRRIGLTDSAMRKRLVSGRLHRLYPNVYAVGHPNVDRHGRLLAAVHACGERAVLSHRSAASLWELRPDARTSIDVSSPTRRGYTAQGIDLHRTRTLLRRDLTRLEGIPCTSVARTLLDLAGVVDRQGLARAIDRAEILRVFDLREVEDVISRAAGRRGTGKLDRALSELRDPSLTRSELEQRLLSMCREAALPTPIVNARIELPDGALEVDFLWPHARLIVETDGWATHGTRSQFERDRRRDQRLTLAGYTVVRFTWRRIRHASQEVVATIARLLAAGRSSGEGGIRTHEAA